MINKLKKIEILTKVFVKDFYQRTKLINKENNNINKKSVWFWIIILLGIAMTYISYKSISWLKSNGMPELFLTLYMMFTLFLLVLQTIAASSSVYFFSKDLEFILPLPVRPIELLVSKYNTLLIMLYSTEFVFSVLPFFLYGFMNYTGFKYFLLIAIILILNIYGKILEENEESTRIRLKNEEIRYKKENEKVLSKMAEDIYRLEHNLRYILMQVKINEENKKYDENIELIDQYIRNFGKFKAIINTDNPYFDYFMNQKINDLSSNGIDVHTSINISHSDYYLDREYVEYLIKMINMFKPKVTQITINVYEKQEFNIIEILTSKNIELKIDNSIKQLAQHLDAQYKNTQDDNICIFKSIQSMK